MLKECISKNFKMPFVQVEEDNTTYYVLCDGVVFSKEEITDSNVDVIELHRQRLATKSNMANYKETKESGKVAWLPIFTVEKETDLEKKQKRIEAFRRYLNLANNKKTKVVKEVKSKGKKFFEVVSKVFKHTSKVVSKVGSEVKQGASKFRIVKALLAMLLVVSIGAIYVSTQHTAKYLCDYVDKGSAWLTSIVISCFCAFAFEVVILFMQRKKKVIGTVFCVLWIVVSIFSILTTVSVFYDKYNDRTIVTNQSNNEMLASKAKLDILLEQEQSIQEAIEFKKKDIEYRQEREWATNTRVAELEKLQKQLSDIRQERINIVSTDSANTVGEVAIKESFFNFLGRVMKLQGGILEFVMSMLGAIFINVITPFTLASTVYLLQEDI